MAHQNQPIRDNNLKYIAQTLIAMIQHFQAITNDEVFEIVKRDIGKKV